LFRCSVAFVWREFVFEDFVKHLIKLALTAATFACVAWNVSAAGPLAAKVNDVEITALEVDKFIQAASGPSGMLLKPGIATERLIGLELLAQEAIRRGKDRNVGRQALANDIVKEFMAANPLSETDVRNEYDRFKAAQPKQTEYKISIIVVKTDAEAKSILGGLAEGKPFASFVTRSIDENSKRDGGTLDWMKAKEMSPPIMWAVSKMEVGTVAKEPLRESYGFVILKLDSVREDSSFPVYAEVRDELARSVLRQRDARMMKPLADRASIQQFEGYANITINQNGERSFGPYVRKVEAQR